MQRVQRELEASSSDDRRANFTCALALAMPHGPTRVFEGKVFGTVVWPPRGTRGFGYDPIFVPDGHSETFGEMDPDLKNRLSHRMRAFEKLILAAYDKDMDEPFGVYVHWPFCRAKCPYCDFNSHVRHGGIDEARFLSAYLSELEYFASLTPGRNVTSIFFGGGTPSLMLPQTVAAILEAIARHWSVQSDAEITLEANPTSVEAENFAGYRCGRRQPAVARRAGARRSKPQIARPTAHGRRSAGRACARQAAFRARVVRSDLCAGRTDGDRVGSGADGARWIMPPTTSRSISSPSRRARRSPRGMPPARCASLTASRRASCIA